MQNYPNRKLNRLGGYDYSQDGYYFVTICTKNHENFFGKIKNGKMFLNDYGQIVQNQWIGLPDHYQNCILDEYIVMPNHIHGIVIINNKNNNIVGNGLKPFPTPLKPFPTPLKPRHSLSEFIRGFKTFSSKNINIKYGKKIFQWQKSFYDHIIGNEK